jgi:hypothetical protein
MALNREETTEERIGRHMKNISQHFIKARIASVCLYASALLKERLEMEGVSMKMVAGYLQTTRGKGEIFRHVWLEKNGIIYDVSIDILKNVSWTGYVQFQHHRTLLPHLRRTDTNFEDLERGISLYQLSPYDFWSEFDSCTASEIHRTIGPVINKLRDSFLGLN